LLRNLTIKTIIEMIKIYAKKVAILVILVTFSFSVKAQITPPKNIIFLIGDGMSYNTVTAANYYEKGEDGTVSYQLFPVKYAMSTYNGQANQEYRSDSAWIDFEWVRTVGNYTDSAPAATAFSTGKKTYDGAIGVDMQREELTHFMQYAKSIGKSAGVVTTVQFSHATPAGHVAHNENRNNYADIANEMLNSDIDVIIGAGHPDYDDNAQPRDNKEYVFVGGENTWNSLTANTLKGWTFSDDSTTIAQIAKGVNVPDKLVAVPRVATTLQQVRTVGDAQTPYADAFNLGVNRLPELSMAALNVLSKNDEGFVVMIEGGAIDWANHANQKGRMIEEQIDFNQTVDAVIEWVEANGGWENNLVVVTSDHECGYLLGELDNDNRFTTNPIVNNGVGQVPGMKYNSGQHTNMLVPMYAKGSGSEIFNLHADREDALRGKYIDNTEIAKTFFTIWDDLYNGKQIKNLIYMVSDGWGENQIKATNYFMGETQAYESFPAKLFMSTYHGMGVMGSENIEEFFTSYNSLKAWSDINYINIKPTDSAPAATAMSTGEKTYDGSINKSIDMLSLKTLTEIAKEKGKAAGVISSVEFSHATPAAFGGAHNLSRNNYVEIANEMLSSQIDVIMGTGHPDYDDNGRMRTDKNYSFIGGEATWNALKSGTLNNWSLMDDKDELIEIVNGINVPNKLLFVAKAATTLQQARTGDTQVVNEDNLNMSVPRLVDMTKASLNVLGRNDNGFFIMIEGGAIDWACHANQKGRLIEEQNDFNKSVDAVIEWVEQNSSWDETLLIVTGDHETGYLGGESNQDLGLASIEDNGEGQIPGMKFYSGGHTNQLVPFYAKGIGAEELIRLSGDHDMKRGYYIDNTAVATLTKSLWGQLTDDFSGVEDNSTPVLYTNDKLRAFSANGVINIISPEIEGEATIRILNANGQVMYTKNSSIVEGVTEVPAPDYNGVLFVLLTQGNKSLSAKCFIK